MLSVIGRKTGRQSRFRFSSSRNHHAVKMIVSTVTYGSGSDAPFTVTMNRQVWLKNRGSRTQNKSRFANQPFQLGGSRSSLLNYFLAVWRRYGCSTHGKKQGAVWLPTVLLTASTSPTERENAPSFGALARKGTLRMTSSFSALGCKTLRRGLSFAVLSIGPGWSSAEATQYFIDRRRGHGLVRCGSLRKRDPYSKHQSPGQPGISVLEFSCGLHVRTDSQYVDYRGRRSCGRHGQHD
jgi:hypothetical protein